MLLLLLLVPLGASVLLEAAASADGGALWTAEKSTLTGSRWKSVDPAPPAANIHPQQHVEDHTVHAPGATVQLLV